MGWSSYGYVFTRQPNWDRLRELPVRSGRVVGYKHRAKDVWLAGIAHGSDRGAAAFAFQPTADFTVDRRTVTPETRQLLARLDQLGAALDTQYLRFSSGWAGLAVAVATRAEVPAFFFTADDEFLDVGCRVEPRRLVEFAGKFPDFLTRCKDGAVRVLVPDPNGLSSFPAERLDGIRGREGIELIVGGGRQPPPLPVAAVRGRPGKRHRRAPPGGEDFARWGGAFYRFPVELWPPEAGNPADVLGLGTWDLFDTFDRDFEPVFPASIRRRRA
ncbi:hypothetical protein R5W23_005478 [Gemmata sp. JC673]|uniref:Uncharacterized protein n=1 Tax=Gemmata algarum TaxID=2975278 RepID=A0ABU5ET52_9BACT|nr:hypothetical protein [Gemmata algarum]MDY3558385.1 hypothetical protein [Gemmata algarum]